MVYMKNLLVSCFNLYNGYKRKQNDKYIRKGLASGEFGKGTILNFHECGTKISVFKECTNETISLAPIYKNIQSGSFVIDWPEIALWKIKNAVVYNHSDFIKVENGIVWPKFFKANFINCIPKDSNLVSYSDHDVIIKRGKKQIKINTAYSLLGVYSDIWSHGTSEYFPKITEISSALSDYNGVEKLKVLVPNYSDKQFKDIMYEAIMSNPNVEIVEVEDDVEVLVETLYIMDRPARFNDHCDYVEIGDSTQPAKVAEVLRDKLVKPLLSRYGNEINSYTGSRKLYLVRRGTYRAMKNFHEVEEFFVGKGFVLVEPHKLSMAEKVAMFNNAEYIVGPYSSAFSNTIFCKPGTKALVFSNNSFSYEGYIVMHQQHFGIYVLRVTGTDIYENSLIHCDYFVPLDKIKDACEYHGIPL